MEDLMDLPTIWKYELPIVDHPVIYMPRGAKVLSVQMQRGVPCIWAEVLSSMPGEERHFRLVGTGHEIRGLERSRFIGTFQVDAVLVFHLFELD